MGLTFSVGNPSDAFIEGYAEHVRTRLVEAFGLSMVLDSTEPAYSSDELGWSGWVKLQECAADAVGADRVPHLLSMEAWSGCYVPAATEPTAFDIEGQSAPLSIGSLTELVAELKAVGAVLGLPADEPGLRELLERYDDEDDEDEEMNIQTYAHLLLAAYVAEDRRQPLWVVK